MNIEFIKVQGQQATQYLDDLAHLRVTVFREFPYLYEGDLAYEQKYLQTYFNSPHSLAILVKVDGRVAGASTCIPLKDEVAEIREPYARAGYDTNKIFYFGESIILKELRGQGIGSQFFKLREEHAKHNLKELGWTSFCAVQRPVDHPLRPAGYQPLNDFWQKRGYGEKPEIKIHLSWQDVDQPKETSKSLVAWLKEWK